MQASSYLEQHPEQSDQLHEGDLDKIVPNLRVTSHCTSYTDVEFIDESQLLSLPADDITFLQSEGCFSLPGPAALEEFIHHYFKRVHSMVPVIDEAEFWRIYRRKTVSSCKLSLFVLQSMLFASSAVGVSPHLC